MFRSAIFGFLVVALFPPLAVAQYVQDYTHHAASTSTYRDHTLQVTLSYGLPGCPGGNPQSCADLKYSLSGAGSCAYSCFNGGCGAQWVCTFAPPIPPGSFSFAIGADSKTPITQSSGLTL